MKVYDCPRNTGNPAQHCHWDDCRSCYANPLDREPGSRPESWQLSRRFKVLACPDGTLTARAAHDQKTIRLLLRPAGWEVVATVNRPLTTNTARAAYRALMHARPGRF